MLDRLREGVSFVLRPRDVVLTQAAGGRDDRSERRPEVVRNGVQQRRFEGIRPLQNVGLHRFAAERRAFDSLSDLIRHREEHTVFRSGKRRCPGDPDQNQAPNLAITTVDWNNMKPPRVSALAAGC